MAKDPSAGEHPRRASRSKQRRPIVRALEVLLALGLLTFVGWNLPWRDTLVLETQEGDLKVPGRILGEWKGEAGLFAFDPDAEPNPAWPAEWRAALAAGQPLAVTRERDATGTGVSWRPGLPRVFLDVRPAGLALALGLLVVGVFFGVTRWWRLLRLAGCRTAWTDACRLTFLGLFFNLVLPGLTGGDLVKAGLVVRDNPHARADALVSVVMDRVLGLWTLLGLAAGVLLAFDHEAFGRLRLPVVGAFLAGTVLIAIALHPASRRVIQLERWIERLPQARRLRKLDRAAQIYAARPLELLAAAGLSLVNHMCTAGALWALGGAFGATLGFAAYVAVGSVANTITAVPIAPGGWGLGEAAYGTLFALVGSAATLGVAVSVSYRLLMHALGFGGGLVLLLPGGARARRAAREAREDGLALDEPP